MSIPIQDTITQALNLMSDEEPIQFYERFL